MRAYELDQLRASLAGIQRAVENMTILQQQQVELSRRLLDVLAPPLTPDEAGLTDIVPDVPVGSVIEEDDFLVKHLAGKTTVGEVQADGAAKITRGLPDITPKGIRKPK